MKKTIKIVSLLCFLTIQFNFSHLKCGNIFIDILENKIKDIKEKLENNKYNVNENRMMRTPLQHAIKNIPQVKIETIKLLLDNNADPNIPDARGNTPLHTIIQFFGDNLSKNSN